MTTSIAAKFHQLIPVKTERGSFIVIGLRYAKTALRFDGVIHGNILRSTQDSP